MSRVNLQALEQKITEEAKKLEQAKARMRKLNARKSKLSRAERTRRLILIGAVMVAKAEKEPEFKASLMKWLDDGITADRDRALFDLSSAGKQDQNTHDTPKHDTPKGDENRF